MLIVGIAGGAGSGKTTVVKKIIEKLPADCVTVIPQDSYYKDSGHLPIEERQKINFDHPDSIEWSLLIDHIKNLKQNKPIEQPVYSYVTCTRNENTLKISPHKVIIVEGILVLSNKELRDLMDLKIFVYTDADDRLSRVIKRDIVERGRDIDAILNRYEKTVKPSHSQFIEPTMSYADIIIPHGGNNDVAIDLMTKFIIQNINN